MAFVWNLVGFLGENLSAVHWVIEGVLICAVSYLLVQKSYKPKVKKISLKEEEELLREWEPVPLVPPLSDRHKLDVETAPEFEGTIIPRTRVQNTDALNLTCASYLGLVVHPAVVDAARQALKKYGTGSCGPRGFYGTIDVHLQLEKDIKRFFEREDSVIYSSHYAAVTSIIMSLSGKYDILIVDSGVRHSIKVGVDLSRAKVYWFEHNNIDELEKIWVKLDKDRKSGVLPKSTRFWVMVEGVYENFGDMCDLPRLLDLKKRYCFRIFLEDSNGIGVLGEHQRGTLEHYGFPQNSVEIIVGSLATVMSSDGGFCTGDSDIVDFQRLSASGYVFSASQPPFLASSAISVLQILNTDEGRALREDLANLIETFHREGAKVLSPHFTMVSSELSPVQHLQLENPQDNDLSDERTLQQIVDACLESEVLITRAKYVEEWNGKPLPSIRVLLNTTLTESDIHHVCQTLASAANRILVK
mmetsp:Transcript_28054/g.78472  ORF Transcript_28054/g.78472 Transcript_28054/m.78472 type:complete len:473 (+) Transcript_28054:48-1466(+)